MIVTWHNAPMCVDGFAFVSCVCADPVGKWRSFLRNAIRKCFSHNVCNSMLVDLHAMGALCHLGGCTGGVLGGGGAHSY